MKTVAYLRVSTGGQDLASQKLAILDYARWDADVLAASFASAMPRSIGAMPQLVQAWMRSGST